MQQFRKAIGFRLYALGKFDIMRDYKKYDIWKISKNIAVEVYSITTSFPDEEKFGMVSQIRRCAVSISSNIAEGAARETDKDFRRFLSIALGSLFELETQIIISNELNYLEKENTQNLLERLNHLKMKIINLM